MIRRSSTTRCPCHATLGHGLNDNAMLARYTSAFTAKAAKIKDYRTRGIIGVEDAAIIAIYTGKIDCADYYDDFIPMVAKALFPVGDPQICVPIQPSNEPVTERWASKPDIVKYNGARIETAEFTKSENAAISAVIYATAHMPRDLVERSGNARDDPQSAGHGARATRDPSTARRDVGRRRGKLEHRGRCAGVGYYSRPPEAPP